MKTLPTKPTEPCDGLLRPAQVANRLAVTPRFVLILAARGELQCVRLGLHAVRFRAEDVERFIAAKTQAA